MLSWLGLLQLILSIAKLVAQRVQEKELLDAGAARAILELVGQANEKVVNVRAARDSVVAPGVLDDPNDRANRPDNEHGPGDNPS